MLASAALVLLMTPGLAFFYGGMVRVKSVLNMLMMNFICIAVVGVVWCLYGYSMVFGETRLGDTNAGDGTFGGLIGWTGDYVGLGNPDAVLAVNNAVGVPVLVFAMFQLMFAIITPALISGAIADRTKFWGWTLFVAVWVTIVLLPGRQLGVRLPAGSSTSCDAEDFAGGTAVHINAGAAGLALALVLGKRIGWRRDPMKPHNVPFVLLGASLLWFGWYGFNAGSEGGADGIAGLAFATTTVATCAAVLGWLLVEQFRDGKPTTVGAASGAVAGLVAITPGLRLRQPARRASRSASSPVCSARCAVGAEVPVRLRRLARRRRRPPGRWSHRHDRHRLLRFRPRLARGLRRVEARPVLRRRPRRCCGSRSSRRSRSSRTRSWSRSSSAR